LKHLTDLVHIFSKELLYGNLSRKFPLTFRVQISPRVKTMHNAWIFPPISLLNISVYRLQPRLFIDSLPYLKKPQKC
jgi:hypothetical protein